MVTATMSKQEQFTELLEPVQDRLYRFAAHQVWSRSDAEDLLQDAVMTAWRKFDDFREGTNFRAWIFQILVHLAANRNRAWSRRQKREVALEQLDFASASTTDWTDVSVVDSPEEVLSQVDDGLARALRTLPPVRRAAFLLRAVEGFRYREIADWLAIPIGTVMSHLSRARRSLREALQPISEPR